MIITSLRSLGASSNAPVHCRKLCALICLPAAAQRLADVAAVAGAEVDAYAAYGGGVAVGEGGAVCVDSNWGEGRGTDGLVGCAGAFGGGLVAECAGGG